MNLMNLVLVKHAQPILDAAVPASLWRLSPEGEVQARHLARRLEEFRPLFLASSSEPKAMRTGEIVAAALGVPMRAVPGLEEFDRPALPLMSPAAHEELNAPIFDDPSVVVLGRESGAQALARFTAGVTMALDSASQAGNLVIVAHGTVISLFVAAHNDIDPKALWKRLTCPSYVVVRLPGFVLERVVEHAGNEAGRSSEW